MTEKLVKRPQYSKQRGFTKVEIWLNTSKEHTSSLAAASLQNLSYAQTKGEAPGLLPYNGVTCDYEGELTVMVVPGATRRVQTSL